jgi:hypothetical protein
MRYISASGNEAVRSLPAERPKEEGEGFLYDVKRRIRRVLATFV